MTKSEFVVMKHYAKRAGEHFDFRFRIPKSNKWDSYACRKEIPTEKNKKILSIKTTIHSRKEALLTGEIESGYGAGILKKWDSGKCNILKYKRNHIVIQLFGKKLTGTFHLVQITNIKTMESKNKNHYLMFKGNLKTSQ